MGSNPNDIVYTPEHIVLEVLEKFKGVLNNTTTILEPFRGGGAFYKELLGITSKVSWCEIEEGVDFFKYNKKHDWIITNPLILFLKIY